MGGSWAIDRRAGWGDGAPSRWRWSRLTSLWSEVKQLGPGGRREFDVSIFETTFETSVWRRYFSALGHRHLEVGIGEQNRPQKGGGRGQLK